jgi:hypothetical protein
MTNAEIDHPPFFYAYRRSVATQTWWLGLIAGVGSSWLASRGHGKREQYGVLWGALGGMRTSAISNIRLRVNGFR